MSNVPERMQFYLDDMYGPVIFNFTPTQTPAGSAPEAIREQWIGLELPVRELALGKHATRYFDMLSGEFKENDGPVPVTGVEAVHALEEADKAKAASFWTPVHLGLLTFRAYEGEFSHVE